MLRAPSLRLIGGVWVVLAMLAGALASGLWLQSKFAWERRLDQAYFAGLRVHAALQAGLPSVDEMVLTPLSPADTALAERGTFAAISDMPHPTYVTRVSLLTSDLPDLSTRDMSLALVSSDLVYPLAALESREALTPAGKFGRLTRLMASYCSDPVILAQNASGIWYRLTGTAPWACSTAPRDLRLPAALLLILSAAALLSSVAATSQQFRNFADALRRRSATVGPQLLPANGPAELRDLADSVNSHLEDEWAHLERRAELLTGISHDLGTPATRLRLRVALLSDEVLRRSLTADIDQMTGMIDGVLAYTRSSMTTEAPRRLSLTALVESIVDDYQDTGRPVELASAEPRRMTMSQSLFSARTGQSRLEEEPKILVVARPQTLQRAITNLVENALKYGRKATLRVSSTSTEARVIIEDEGGAVDPSEIESLVAPFRRGANTSAVPGFGLGLSIAVAAAEQHGGRLEFEQASAGLRAILVIERGLERE